MLQIFVKSLVQALAFLLVTLIMLALTFNFGPKIEDALFPVVTDAKIIVVPPTEGDYDGMHILLNSTKQRENCELLDRFVSVRIGDIWVRGTAFFKDEATGQLVPIGKSRPSNDNIVDNVYIRPRGNGLHIVLVHRCHPFWFSTTTETYLPDLSKMQ